MRHSKLVFLAKITKLNEVEVENHFTLSLAFGPVIRVWYSGRLNHQNVAEQLLIDSIILRARHFQKSIQDEPLIVAYAG